MLDPAHVFKSLADDTRLRCAALLHTEGKLCVCELTHALALSQPKISRHLALLRHSGLLVDSREGQWVYYRINEGLPPWARTALQAATQGMENHPSHCQDRARLHAMSDRPGAGPCCA